MAAIDADAAQLQRYAADFARLYGAERQRRLELAEAHRQLRSYAGDLNRTVAHLKGANAALARANELNEAILHSTSNGIVALDLERRVMKTNAATERMLSALGVREKVEGCRLEEILPGVESWLVPSLARALCNTGGDRLVEQRLTRRSRSITANVAVTPMRDQRGEVVGYVLGVEDVSLPRHLAAMLYRYMSKPVADALIERERHILGGAAQQVSIMFADIRGFTAMSEAAGPQATVSLLNEYFSAVVKAMFEAGGVLDKYIGDAIMGVFGVPFPEGSDPVRCVDAALTMVRSLKALNRRRRIRRALPIEIGIGIDTGEAVVGNIGCEQRMDFTVIGDTVNVASRLESVNKVYGTTILVSERTAAAVAARHRLREIDMVRLKGKSEPIKLYEVVDAARAGGRGAGRAYERGLCAYRAGDWGTAARHFRASLAVRPCDGPAQAMLRRCEHFRSAPPALWDGVSTMELK